MVESRKNRTLTWFAGGVIVALAVVLAGWTARSSGEERGAAARVAAPQVQPVPEEASEVAAPMQISDREPWNELAAVGAAPPAGNPNDPISVFVHFDPRTDRLQRPLVTNFTNLKGAFVKYEYEILPNVINVRNLPRRELPALRRLAGVVKVEEDYEVTIQHNDSMPLIRAYQSQLQAAGITETGAGVRACVIDTGIDSNSIMYSSRIDAAAGWDFVNNDSNPEDDHGHGSHVAGTVLGGANVTADFACATTGPESMQGVAPGATLIGVKVLSASGSGSASNIIAGINRCASLTLPGGQADVINLSLGGGQFAAHCDTDTMAQACNNAVAAGVVVAVAAGNGGFTNAVSSPACASQVITVAASYDENYPNCDFPSQTSFSFCLNSFCTSTCTDNSPVVDQRCCFSNRSSMLEVTGPGCIIFSDDSTVPAGNGLVGFCGTSQATPHVAGLAALLLDVNPSFTPAQVRTFIINGAVDKGAAGFDNLYGWGRIDVINSMQLAGAGGCQTNPECDDGLFCNGAETCVSGSCQAGTAPNCNDGVACTTDSCNEATDSCDHAPNNGACGDGLFCNGSEVCNVTLGCQAGTPPNCADSVACTTDSCNEATDSCDHTPNNAACSDGLFCNGSEVCNVTLGCQAGTAPNCADSVACTTDSCNEATDSCDHVPNNAACDDGQFCNGAETCNVTLGCQAGSDPCPGQACDEGTDTCVACLTNADCADGLFCNGVEVCNAGNCQAGTAVNCDDGIACTGDSCNEGTDSCDHAPNNALCNDGLFCNGVETCNVSTGCVAGTDPCGGAGCDEGTDTCLGGAEIWMSFTSSAVIPGVGTVANEDIVAYNPGSGTWSLIFDGSDVGLSGFAIGGMAVTGAGDILLSFTVAGSIPGLIGGPSGTSVDDSDIVRFTPTSLGSTTAGTFNFHFDGSDVGLSATSETIDAITLTSSGSLVISTTGTFSGTGASGADEDLFVFTATSLGSVTAGNFAFHFDGSDVGLSTSSDEDVDAAGITTDGTILLSTVGPFSVTGVSGEDEDVFEFFPTQLGTTTSGTFAAFLDLSAIGIDPSEDVGSVEEVP